MTLKALINKQTLKKIVNHLKVTLSFLQKKTGCTNLSLVDKWLNPELDNLPSFRQAKQIATSLKIPFAALYMNEDQIPLNNLPKFVEYRTLPDSFAEDESVLNVAIFDLLNHRDLFISLKEELEEQIILFNFDIKENLDPLEMAEQIRLLFQLDLNYQFKTKSSRQFYLYIRNKIENKGIFIQCFTDVDILMARGLSIYDHKLPIIGLNDKDSAAGKSFSIIHELVHIIRQQTTYCNAFYDSFTDNNNEIYCNAVAGELLVPSSVLEIELKQHKMFDSITFNDIKSLSNKFSVSKEVIVRRLLDTKQIDKSTYTNFFDIFNKEIEEDKKNKKLQRQAGLHVGYGKPSHLSLIDRTSSQLSFTFFKCLNHELLTKFDISQYLMTSQKTTELFLSQFLNGNSK
jgi:Zn-dependent peptidase ImmA (M78 family)